MPEQTPAEQSEATFLKIYAAPDKGVRVLAAADPGAVVLAEKLGEVARRTLSLRRLLEIKQKYDTTLRRIFVYVSGLSSISAMHATYNQMAGNLAPGEQQELVDATNELLNALSKHPAFLNIVGVLCDVDSRRVTQLSLGTQMKEEVNQLTNLLVCDEMREPYKEWSATMSTGPYTGRELYNATFVESIANRLIADAVQTLAKVDPKNDVVVAALRLMEKDDADLESPPDSAKSIVEFTFQARARLSLALAANVGGVGIQLLGKDALLIKLVQTYCAVNFGQAVTSQSAAANLKRTAIGKIIKAVGGESEGIEKKFDQYVTKANEAALKVEQYQIAKSASPTVPEIDALRLAQEEQLAEVRVLRNRFRRTLVKKFADGHPTLDGGLANAAIAVFSAVQAVDASYALLVDADTPGILKAKAASDAVGAAAGAAGASINVYARVRRIQLADDTVLGFFGKVASDYMLPSATIISGVLQAISGGQENSGVDLSAGILNAASGAFSGFYRDQIMKFVLSQMAEWLPVEAIPIIGPACAIASVAIVAVDVAQKLVQSNVERYFHGALDELKKARWAEGDSRHIAENLGLTSTIKRVEAAVQSSRFHELPIVPGVSRPDLVRALAFYTGSENAELMIYSPPGTPGHEA